MTLQEIQNRLKHIEKIQDDDESAHGEEDQLFRDFIFYVSTNPDPELAQKAAEVLKTLDLEFCRWCA